MPTATKTRPVKVLSGAPLRRQFTSWARLRAETEERNTRLERFRDTVLLPSLEANGEEDEKGSQWITFDPPIEVDVFDKKAGKEITVTYTAIKRERRVSQSFNEEAAQKILASKGQWLNEKQEKALNNLLAAVPSLTITMGVDQDAFRQAFYKKEITEEELDSCFTENVSYAFVPQKR